MLNKPANIIIKSLVGAEEGSMRTTYMIIVDQPLHKIFIAALHHTLL